jgi:hypothetical protein
MHAELDYLGPLKPMSPHAVAPLIAWYGFFFGARRRQLHVRPKQLSSVDEYLDEANAISTHFIDSCSLLDYVVQLQTPSPHCLTYSQVTYAAFLGLTAENPEVARAVSYTCGITATADLRIRGPHAWLSTESGKAFECIPHNREALALYAPTAQLWLADRRVRAKGLADAYRL